MAKFIEVIIPEYGKSVKALISQDKSWALRGGIPLTRPLVLL